MKKSHTHFTFYTIKMRLTTTFHGHRRREILQQEHKQTETEFSPFPAAISFLPLCCCDGGGSPAAAANMKNECVCVGRRGLLYVHIVEIVGIVES